jgi:NTP pyrophosphatase (non-canonical NTP hydrolase)
MEHKIKHKWQQRAVGIHERFLKLARAKGGLTSEAEVLHFLVLALCGEAGELANLVKKSWRGDEVDREQLREEIADIRIYLEHLCRHLDVDLDRACEEKLEEVHERLLAKERREEADVVP